MKTQELRIGNLVNYKIIDDLDERKEWYEVSEIDAEDLLIMDDDYQPIPLTDEWLFKFGVLKNNEYPYKFLNGYIKIRNGLFFYKYHLLDIELKYVHQLQNLYFSLTGEELIIENK